MSDLKPDNSLPKNLRELMNRRELLMGTSMVGMAAMLGMQQALAGGHNKPRVELTETQQLELEQANNQLVADFVAAYATRDAAVIDSFVSDDIVYQITPGMAEIVGREAFYKHNANMFKGLDKVAWVNSRQFTIGPIVINDRVDDFIPYAGSKVPRMQFRVAGYFLVEDNKIQVWRDFPYPGAKQLIEPAPKA
jgi:limonene-1,2-epoxide hydrolase